MVELFWFSFFACASDSWVTGTTVLPFSLARSSGTSCVFQSFPVLTRGKSCDLTIWSGLEGSWHETTLGVFLPSSYISRMPHTEDHIT